MRRKIVQKKSGRQSLWGTAPSSRPADLLEGGFMRPGACASPPARGEHGPAQPIASSDTSCCHDAVLTRLLRISWIMLSCTTVGLTLLRYCRDCPSHAREARPADYLLRSLPAVQPMGDWRPRCDAEARLHAM